MLSQFQGLIELPSNGNLFSTLPLIKRMLAVSVMSLCKGPLLTLCQVYLQKPNLWIDHEVASSKDSKFTLYKLLNFMTVTVDRVCTSLVFRSKGQNCFNFLALALTAQHPKSLALFLMAPLLQSSSNPLPYKCIRRVTATITSLHSFNRGCRANTYISQTSQVLFKASGP